MKEFGTENIHTAVNPDVCPEGILLEIEDKDFRNDLFRLYQEINENRINTEAVESEFQPFLDDLKEGIDAHAFACIVGDDKSARLPTLTIGSAINEIYRARDEEIIPLLFIDPHNYTGAMGGRRGWGEESKERHDILKTKVKDFFNEAGVKKGTILLVTDYVDSGSAIKSFEDMAQEFGCSLRVINDPSWHFSRLTSGLNSDEEKYSIHASPQFIHIENPMDVTQQLEKLEESFSPETFFGFRRIILDIKITKDPNFPIESVKEVLYSGEGIKQDVFRHFILHDLTFPQQKLFLNLLRYEVVVEPRERALSASRKMAEWYISR